MNDPNPQATSTEDSATPRVFISYCKEDKTVADAVCAGIENAGYPCWIAPRNVRPGENWGRSIIKSIAASRVMVVVFSSHTNESPHVMNEIERAVSHRMTIIPFRIENVQPSEDLELFISSRHWLDAFSPPYEPKIAELISAVQIVLGPPVAAKKETVHAPAPPPAAPAAPPVPAVPGELCYHHFVVLRREDGSYWELGRGAMGVTYKAIDSRLRRTVALKVVSPERLATGSAREKFLLEAQATAALQHPNIASIYYFGEQEGSCFYAMEFVDGLTLEDMVHTRGPLRPEDALSVVSQAAAALGFAHETGMVHRDVKPTNIMVVARPDGTLSARMIDFGLAAAVGGDHGENFEGTPLYASPEQLDHGAPDARSDVYSLGATLYFALSGKPPYEGTYAQIASRQLMQPFPAENIARAPAEVVSLVARLMDRDPANRPQNGADARSLLDTLLRNFLMSGQQTAMEWMAARFTSISRVGAIEGGSLHRVAAGGEERAVMAFDTSARGLAVSDQVAAVAPVMKSLASPAVRRVSEVAKVKDGLIVATEWMSGTRLLSILRVRRVLPASEAALILVPLAAALDEAAAAGLPLPQLGLREILLQPEQKPETHIDEWPSLRPLIDLLPVGEAKEVDVNTTIVSSAALAQVSSYAAGDRSPAAVIASLAYEILGGMSSPGLGPYVPLAELSQDANSALREIFQNPQDTTTATELVARILPAPQPAAQGAPAAAAPPQPARRMPARRTKAEQPQAPAPAAAPAPKSKMLIYAGAGLAALLLVGGLIALLSGRSVGEKKPPSATATAAATPSATATPAAVAKSTATPATTEPSKKEEPAAGAGPLENAKALENKQDFVGALGIYGDMLERNPQDADVRRHAENVIARLEEKASSLASNRAFTGTLRRLADAGLGRASMVLAGIVKQSDPKESLRLFKIAADQGDRRAAVQVGNMIAGGKGVPRADFVEAATWFKKAADQGDSEGMLLYAECLRNGQGVEPDPTEAARLYSSAMALGEVRAKSRLAELYRKGAGVPKIDFAMAFRLFQEAANEGLLEAQGNLGVMIINGENGPADPAKAVSLWKDGALKEDDTCMFFYAQSLEVGAVGQPDVPAATEWYRKAASMGNPGAIQWCAQHGVTF